MRYTPGTSYDEMQPRQVTMMYATLLEIHLRDATHYEVLSRYVTHCEIQPRHVTMTYVTHFEIHFRDATHYEVHFRYVTHYEIRPTL